MGILAWRIYLNIPKAKNGYDLSEWSDVVNDRVINLKYYFDCYFC